MKYLKSFIFLLIASSTVYAGITEKESIAREFVQADLKASDTAISDGLLDGLVRSSPGLAVKSDVIVKFFMEIIHSKELEDIMAKHYLETCTTEELQELLALAKSDNFKLYKLKTTGGVLKQNTELLTLLRAKMPELQRRLNEK